MSERTNKVKYLCVHHAGLVYIIRKFVDLRLRDWRLRLTSLFWRNWRQILLIKNWENSFRRAMGRWEFAKLPSLAARAGSVRPFLKKFIIWRLVGDAAPQTCKQYLFLMQNSCTGLTIRYVFWVWRQNHVFCSRVINNAYSGYGMWWHK